MQQAAGARFIVTGAQCTAAAIEAAYCAAKTKSWLMIGIFGDQPVADRDFHLVGKIAGGSTHRKHENAGDSPFPRSNVAVKHKVPCIRAAMPMTDRPSHAIRSRHIAQPAP